MSRLIEFLESIPEVSVEVDSDHLLREGGLGLDSVGIMELIMFLERVYDIEPGSYRIQDLETVADVEALIHDLAG